MNICHILILADASPGSHWCCQRSDRIFSLERSSQHLVSVFTMRLAVFHRVNTCTFPGKVCTCSGSYEFCMQTIKRWSARHIPTVFVFIVCFCVTLFRKTTQQRQTTMQQYLKCLYFSQKFFWFISRCACSGRKIASVVSLKDFLQRHSEAWLQVKPTASRKRVNK